ncbi:Dehydrogenase E1 component [Arabidopsis thaliana x Arabidopsis arenosa]|uniref:Dehydrogenase E1 component n=2 Tax=Arabidopsis TaxID=3701 RepID=A0A8T2BPV9_ARASU|nr:Dehydrogenase E1 component [Arabidopsis thaliana x Arabidopsis arenosa]KAG7589598.1 Dehydrogenase E1 component [Arabidopsis suecica]
MGTAEWRSAKSPAYFKRGDYVPDPGALTVHVMRSQALGRLVRDPIDRVRKLIISHDKATDKELKDMEKEVRKEVEAAVAKAKESPVPDSSELSTNIYVKGFGAESFGEDRKELRATLP